MKTVEERGQALSDFVLRLGYAPSMVQRRFPVWTEDAVETAAVVAFTQAAPAPQDMTSAAVIGIVANARPPVPLAVSIARALATPTAMIAGDEGVELWAIEAADRQERLDHLPYAELRDPPPEVRRRLDPEAVTAAKRISGQLSLFPSDVADLLRQARASTSSRLQARVELALELALGRAGKVEHAEQMDRSSRLVVGAMAALMVNDKFRDIRPPASGAVLTNAAARFPGYFDWVEHLPEREQRTLELVVSELARDITYASLDPAIVSHVYEAALVTEASRRDLGIYYTPPDLARAVLRHLPIEDLPPDARTVMDPACGSGTLLLAAYERLRAVAPSNLEAVQRHTYATALLSGFDADAFAVQIASLALLLNALPQGNGWQVERRDVLQPVDRVPTAHIVVSNPPWRQLAGLRGRRAQVADRFVHQMLAMLSPEGLLAAILPASWLASRSTERAREAFFAQCDVFELWRLPEDTFEAELAPTVVFAWRRPQSGPYLFKRALRRAAWKDRFLHQREHADVARVTAPGTGLTPSTFLRGPLDADRDALKSLRPLTSLLADFSRGPAPKAPVGARGGEGRYLWLRRHQHISTLTEPPQESLLPIRYPEEFNWRVDDGSRFERPKLLVSAVRKADNPWRLKVLLDLEGGIIPRESLFVVTPEREDHLPGLAALLSSHFASAWIDTLNPSRTIKKAIIGAVPVPLGDHAWQRLGELGIAAMEAAAQGALTRTQMCAIDAAVADLLGLTAITRQRLVDLFAGFSGPEGGIRYPLSPAGAAIPSDRRKRLLRRYGAVMETNGDKLRIWIPGVTARDGDWMTPPRSLLGRLVRPGATFEVELHGDDIESAHFEFQRSSYLDLEDLGELTRKPV